MPENEDDEEDDGSLKPAWGGAKRGEGIPVPPEFESVKDLGPAIEVIGEMPGIQLIPNFGTPMVHVIARFRDGFAYRVQAMMASHRRDVHVWRWEEVVEITSDVWVKYPNARNTRIKHAFTLTKIDGEKVELNDCLEKIGVIGHIKDAVFTLLEPQLTKRYKSGEELAFGSVKVHHKNGLALEDKRFAWDDVQNVSVENGRFKIALKGEKHEVRVMAIPNIEILCKLIGLNLSSAALAYV